MNSNCSMDAAGIARDFLPARCFRVGAQYSDDHAHPVTPGFRRLPSTRLPSMVSVKFLYQPVITQRLNIVHPTKMRCFP